MKFVIALIALALAGTCLATSDERKAMFDPVEINALRLDPDEYKNDKIAISGAFLGAIANFPSYVEKSGFAPDRYLCFSVGSASIPIMARKKDDLVAQIAAMRKGTTVTIYGRLKEFREEPHATRLPKYYLEFEALEVAMPAAGKDNANQPAAGKPAQDGRPGWRERRRQR